MSCHDLQIACSLKAKYTKLQRLAIINMLTLHCGRATFLWVISSPVPAFKGKWARSLHGRRWWDEIIQICALHPDIEEKKKKKIEKL